MLSDVKFIFSVAFPLNFRSAYGRKTIYRFEFSKNDKRPAAEWRMSELANDPLNPKNSLLWLEVATRIYYVYLFTFAFIFILSYYFICFITIFNYSIFFFRPSMLRDFQGVRNETAFSGRALSIIAHAGYFL